MCSFCFLLFSAVLPRMVSTKHMLLNSPLRAAIFSAEIQANAT